MGHIKEPKNVDLNIESKPLSNKEKNEISDFIKKRKAEIKRTKLKRKKKSKQTS